MKDWALTTWRENSGAVIAAVAAVLVPFIAGTFLVIVALINKHNKKEISSGISLSSKEPICQKPSFNFERGKSHGENSNYRIALQCYDSALIEYDISDLDRAVVYCMMGLMHANLTEFDKAIDCYAEARAIYRYNGAKKNQGELSWIHINLSDSRRLQALSRDVGQNGQESKEEIKNPLSLSP